MCGCHRKRRLGGGHRRRAGHSKAVLHAAGSSLLAVHSAASNVWILQATQRHPKAAGRPRRPQHLLISAVAVQQRPLIRHVGIFAVRECGERASTLGRLLALTSWGPCWQASAPLQPPLIPQSSWRPDERVFQRGEPLLQGFRAPRAAGGLRGPAGRRAEAWARLARMGRPSSGGVRGGRPGHTRPARLQPPL